MVTNAEKARRYRAKYPEKVRAYDRLRYRLKRRLPKHQKLMGDRVCALCGVRMASEFASSLGMTHGTRKHCRPCYNTSKNLIQALNMREWRKKQKVKNI